VSDFGGFGHRSEIDNLLQLVKSRVEQIRVNENADSECWRDWLAVSDLGEEVVRLRDLFKKLGLSDHDGRRV